MSINLLPHQADVLKATESKNKVAYYLDMGLGKTFVGSEKMIDMRTDVNLVICQKSKVNDWVEHFQKHYNDHPFLTDVYDLTDKKQFEGFFQAVHEVEDCELDPRQVVGIINYELAFRREKLTELKDFTLMLDESSMIQNETAKRSKFILKKLKPSNVILLSGTPTSGKYERLWSQMHLLGWGISKKLYYRQYVDVEFSDDGYPIIKGYKNVDRLKQKMRDYGCVFMKSDEVLNLPTQNFIDIKVPESKEYKHFKKHGIVKFDDVELVGDTTLTKLLYSRMLCGAYNQDKIKAFIDLIDSTDDRVIVFYNFNNELESILRHIEKPYSVVNGKVKDLYHYENSNDSVTFIQYQAGAMGLNLQKANKIIYFSPPLSSELFEQSKKRIHRIGQEQPCFYYRLKCGIEHRIYDTLAMRRDYTDALFEADFSD